MQSVLNTATEGILLKPSQIVSPLCSNPCSSCPSHSKYSPCSGPQDPGCFHSGMSSSRASAPPPSLPAHSYRPPVCFAPRPGQANSYLGLCSLFLECSFQNICLVHPLTSFKSLLKCHVLRHHLFKTATLSPAPPSCFKLLISLVFLFPRKGLIAFSRSVGQHHVGT